MHTDAYRGRQSAEQRRKQGPGRYAAPDAYRTHTRSRGRIPSSVTAKPDGEWRPIMGYEVRGVRDGACGAYEFAEPLPPTMSFAEMLAATRRAADESGHEATLVDDEGETVCGIAPSVPAGSLGVTA
ncbi:hypothetical protein [Bifidobacterium breve]|nr:hypothetical protein [Bifidobacterium breve]